MKIEQVEFAKELKEKLNKSKSDVNNLKALLESQRSNSFYIIFDIKNSQYSKSVKLNTSTLSKHFHDAELQLLIKNEMEEVVERIILYEELNIKRIEKRISEL